MHQIPTELLQKIVNYLRVQPYHHVAAMLKDISEKSEPAKEKQDEQSKESN